MKRRSLDDRLFGVLLRAYPKPFRDRFGPGMRDALAREYASRRPGVVGWTTFWSATVAEAVWFGVRERRGTARLAGPREGGPRMSTWFVTDWRDAWRALRATPIVTGIAVLSLALGIGATTALFSILNSLIFKTLPVRDPGQLVVVDDGSWTNPIWEQIRVRDHQLFDGAFAWSGQNFDLSEHGETDDVAGAYASGAMFDVLGLRPEAGRLLTPADDDRSGGSNGPVAVVSETFWRDRYGRSTDVIGRRLTVNRVPFTIVGVMPAGFFGPDVGRRADVIVPIADRAVIDGNAASLDGRSNWWLEIMARLKPGQTIAQATAALDGVRPQIRAATLPQDWTAKMLANYLAAKSLAFVPAANGESALRAKYQQPLVVLLVVVGAVLLIACANIANLLLARATARRRELSVRLALGASAGRIARQLFLESLLLAGTGAALGLAFAEWGSRILVFEISRKAYVDLSIDARVLAFTTGVAVLTAGLFGLAPMLTVAHVAPTEALNEQRRGVSGDRRWGVRNGLVVLQVALSLALVVAAGLFIRSFVTLTDAALGFTPDPLLIANVDTRPLHLQGAAQLQAFEALRDAAAAVPGVAGVGASFTTPIGNAGWNTLVKDVAVSLPQKQMIPWVNVVSPGWFHVYGMRLLAGRDFTAADRSGGPPVAVVNEAFAHRYFPGQNPVGQHFRAGLSGPGESVYEIVGVVSDAVYRSLTKGFEPILYVPLAQVPFGTGVQLTIRTAAGPPSALRASLAEALGRVEPAAALTFTPFSNQIRDATTQPRIVAALSGFFGGLALLLAALGLYGVTSYAVSRRRSEIGLRMALGAEATGVVRLVLGRVGWLVGLGVVAGAALSFWAAHFVSTLLFGVDDHDALTFAGAAAALLLVGLAAGWLPARRAARIDPAEVLRET